MHSADYLVHLYSQCVQSSVGWLHTTGIAFLLYVFAISCMCLLFTFFSSKDCSFFSTGIVVIPMDLPLRCTEGEVLLASLAQLVEHFLLNWEVLDSNPIRYSGWPGHYNNVRCSARLKTSFELNPDTEGKQWTFPFLSYVRMSFRVILVMVDLFISNMYCLWIILLTRSLMIRNSHWLWTGLLQKVSIYDNVW